MPLCWITPRPVRILSPLSFAQLAVLMGKLVHGWEFASLMKLIYLVNGSECLLMALLVGGLLLVEWLGRKGNAMQHFLRTKWPLRWAACLALLFVLILFGKYNESPAFIYFQF